MICLGCVSSSSDIRTCGSYLLDWSYFPQKTHRSPTQRGQCLATSVLGVELSKKLHHTVTQSHLISLFSEWCSLLICAEHPPETLFYSRENLQGACRPAAGAVRLHHALRSGGLFLSKMFQSHLPVFSPTSPVSRDTWYHQSWALGGGVPWYMHRIPSQLFTSGFFSAFLNPPRHLPMTSLLSFPIPKFYCSDIFATLLVSLCFKINTGFSTKMEFQEWVNLCVCVSNPPSVLLLNLDLIIRW